MAEIAIPEKTGSVRDEKGRFIKGVSGNPAGPPKGYKREKFNRWAETKLMAWLTRAEAMADEDAQMLRFLIEQAIGKPSQSIEATVESKQDIELTWGDRA